MASYDDYSWMDDAACPRFEDLDWYSADKTEQYACRAVCQSQCNVRKECLSTALNDVQIWGIWGGVDDYEIRRALSVDSMGEPAARVRIPRCPYCKRRDLTISGVKTKKGYLTRCNNEECNLEWNIAMIPTKLKKSKKPAR